MRTSVSRLLTSLTAIQYSKDIPSRPRPGELRLDHRLSIEILDDWTTYSPIMRGRW